MAMPMALIIFMYVAAVHSYRLCIPSLSKRISRKLKGRGGRDEGGKREALQRLVEEQAGVSMKDEFAKYAKLDRKINKLKEELKAMKQSQVAARFTISWAVTLTLNTIYTIFIVGLIWCYRHEPIIQLEREWVWPLGTILAFPCGIPGAVGITAWLAICTGIVIRLQGVVGEEQQPRRAARTS